jgi:hypothetical protein
MTMKKPGTRTFDSQSSALLREALANPPEKSPAKASADARTSETTPENKGIVANDR